MLCLVHGSMVAAPGFGKPESKTQAQKVHGGFESFEDEIVGGQVLLYKWYSDYDTQFPKLKSNPMGSLKVYTSDRSRVQSSKEQRNLLDYLVEHQPSVLAAHSKGCQLVEETNETFGLPLSIKTIVLLNSDAQDLDSVKYLTKHFRVINLYSVDDPTLWGSVVLNGGKIREGLKRSKVDGVENIPYPAKGNHNRSLSDQYIKSFLLGLV
ncbi:MAG: hypothetical protein ACRCXZ_06290 [Patescibacteria group bacterium]